MRQVQSPPAPRAWHAETAEAALAGVRAGRDSRRREIVYLFNCRHLRDGVLHREGLLGIPWVLLATAMLLVLQLLFTYLPPLQALFGTADLDLAACALRPVAPRPDERLSNA